MKSEKKGEKEDIMQLEEKTVRKNYIYRGKIINVRCDDAELPNGRPCRREIVEHPGGACVLCVKDGKVALVKQLRYAYGEAIYEIPAGKLNEGEDPMLAAERELGEETGMIADELVLRFVLYPTPGYTNEKIFIYEALGVREGKQHLDEGEFLNVEFVPIEDALEMVENGAICDAKTIVALQRYALEHKMSIS